MIISFELNTNITINIRITINSNVLVTNIPLTTITQYIKYIIIKNFIQ